MTWLVNINQAEVNLWIFLFFFSLDWVSTFRTIFVVDMNCFCGSPIPSLGNLTCMPVCTGCRVSTVVSKRGWYWVLDIFLYDSFLQVLRTVSLDHRYSSTVWEKLVTFLHVKQGENATTRSGFTDVIFVATSAVWKLEWSLKVCIKVDVSYSIISDILVYALLCSRGWFTRGGRERRGKFRYGWNRRRA